ncbi:MAG: hypothetical protein ACX936_07685 [Marinobacter sp.]
MNDAATKIADNLPGAVSEDEWRRALAALRRAENLPIWHSHVPASLCEELDVIFSVLYRIEQQLNTRE